MVRLTIYFKKFPKLTFGDKKRVFNVRSFSKITRREAERILGSYDKRNVLRADITPYNV